MIFISAQPCEQYFLWQVEVQIVNFRKHGISDKMHILVWVPNEIEFETKQGNVVVKRWKESPKTEDWENLQKKYPEVKIFFYKDRGVDKQLYISQLRPHILSEHFEKNPELKNEVIFYHDSDIIFNYLPDFEKLSYDNINWQSDTSSYLDYKYLRDKEIQGNIPENEAISVLANIGRVSIDTIKSYNRKTGGAQYILKNIDSDFWKDVERQCIEIRKAFWYNIPTSINRKYFKSENEGFQSWCADMWAVNMAIWNRGYITDITDDLSFSWATDDIETYERKPIYHNAGALPSSQGIFYKGKWILNSPIGKVHSVKKDSASKFYVQAISEVK